MNDRSMALQGRSFRASRTVHVGSTFAFGKLSQLFPGVVVKLEGEEGDDPDAIAFADPDGDVNVYSLSSEAKRALIEKMTGGVAVATILPGDLRGGRG